MNYKLVGLPSLGDIQYIVKIFNVLPIAKIARIIGLFIEKVPVPLLKKLFNFLWTKLKSFRINIFTDMLKTASGSAISILKQHGGTLLRKLKITGNIQKIDKDLLNIIVAAENGGDDKTLAAKLLKLLENIPVRKLLDKILSFIPSQKILTFLKKNTVKVLIKLELSKFKLNTLVKTIAKFSIKLAMRLLLASKSVFKKDSRVSRLVDTYTMSEEAFRSFTNENSSQTVH